MKIITHIIFFIILLTIVSPALSLENNSFKWQIGEELTYKVKWSFIRLGTIKVQVCDTLTMGNTFVYHVKLFVDSNPLLFFVNMHNVYESYITKDFRLQLFVSEEKIDGITYLAEYRFNYTDSLIHTIMTDMEDPNVTIIKDDPLNETLLDGASMIFYARANSIYTRTDTLISFFASKRGKVAINFKGKNGKTKISALKKPMESYYVDGIVRMKGIAGLTGPYKGWFATGDQRPPLKAEMKVFIGSVKIQLEKWTGWEPVKAR
ncbi:DUF3108 domain-containing protein [candidate division KSB1 bacterium]|nr:DUF3108 domain-containing protein [candidate division KSB1 bacterium]